MKHPLDRAQSGSDSELQRAIGMKKDALPRRASLDLQKRPRSHKPARRAAEFVRIAREEETPVWQR
ncbi:hypothetical protein [Yoonia vestfoldensis]|uniref:hypothetical protein n=1 Tax=Yoonia vestfoldensis TaxID=245188 RepID=UPI000399AE04|nr:hypothetical protein [Yoonia vestfoldensis]